ncbi:MAG: PAC2 family protein [Candidatus Nanoarchaeia archaeon]|nr:PAC2 family protein [Candidatus Nanoarchaeia archaeon]
MTWKITKVAKKIPKLKSPILITGLPGIGNVGKVAVDFLTEELKAKKAYDLFSYTFPHSVFVNEKNLVSLPQIILYYRQFNDKRNDLLFLAGDVQPTDEVASYEFSETLLDIFEKLKGKEIITLGGIGLSTVPKKPKVYCTGNSKEIIKKYKKDTCMDDKLYGVVGPIIGTSGLLLGLSEKRKINAVSFLAETFGHPLYLGIKGSKELVSILNKKLNLKINVKKLEKEAEDAESEMMRITQGLSDVTKKSKLKKIKDQFDLSYIG